MKTEEEFRAQLRDTLKVEKEFRAQVIRGELTVAEIDFVSEQIKNSQADLVKARDEQVRQQAWDDLAKLGASVYPPRVPSKALVAFVKFRSVDTAMDLQEEVRKDMAGAISDISMHILACHERINYLCTLWKQGRASDEDLMAVIGRQQDKLFALVSRAQVLGGSFQSRLDDVEDEDEAEADGFEDEDDES